MFPGGGGGGVLTWLAGIGRSRVIHERGAELPTGTGKSKRASKGISALDPDGVRIKSERGDDPDYYSSTEEESDGGPKVNVERMIEMIDSEEDDEDESPLKGVDKIPVMFPLRLGRIKHEEKERAVPIFKDLDTGKKGGKGGGGRKVKLEEGGMLKRSFIILPCHFLCSLTYIHRDRGYSEN